ncbi:hypothetical protein ACJJTC_008196 [Scirpophaga incertulas]
MDNSRAARTPIYRYPSTYAVSGGGENLEFTNIRGRMLLSKLSNDLRYRRGSLRLLNRRTSVSVGSVARLARVRACSPPVVTVGAGKRQASPGERRGVAKPSIINDDEIVGARTSSFYRSRIAATNNTFLRVVIIILFPFDVAPPPVQVDRQWTPLSSADVVLASSVGGDQIFFSNQYRKTLTK